jgi:hypothetical protein
MEGSMNKKNKQDDEAELPTKLEFEAMDTSGMWFAAAILFAALAAGTIVYRAANDDIRIALSGTTSAPASNLR